MNIFIKMKQLIPYLNSIKTVIVLLSILVLAFSCVEKEKEKTIPEVTEFQFKGHTYYKMRFPYEHYHIIHDPECSKCLGIY